MKSDVIKIDSRGNGFREAITQTVKTAVFTGLDENESLDLQLLTEEMHRDAVPFPRPVKKAEENDVKPHSRKEREMILSASAARSVRAGLYPTKKPAISWASRILASAIQKPSPPVVRKPFRLRLRSSSQSFFPR